MKKKQYNTNFDFHQEKKDMVEIKYDERYFLISVNIIK